MDSLDAKLLPSIPPATRRAGRNLMDAPLRSALAGAVFPLRREHLVLIARENEAPRTMLTLLSGLPARLFGSLDDIELAFDDQARAEAAR